METLKGGDGELRGHRDHRLRLRHRGGLCRQWRQGAKKGNVAADKRPWTSGRPPYRNVRNPDADAATLMELILLSFKDVALGR